MSTTARRTSRLAVAATAATAALAVAAGVSPAVAAAQTPGGPDRIHQCAGRHIDRDAPVVSHADIMIAAPPREVWKVHTDIDSWPTWKADVPYAHRLDSGPFRVGSKFRWSNGGLDITSTVRVVRHDRCTLWTGPASGIQGTHLWTFTPVPGGTRVHTEESWSGAPVEADPAKAQAILDKGLAQGVRDLKQEVEDHHVGGAS